VQGDEFRRVTLPEQRRGVLTHGSILLLTSNPTRTSPVKRGKWILDNILNTPPPDPPPNVPTIDEAAIGKTATLRQQMEQHRSNPACRSCHARMDPLGFSMENFNAIGAWREKDGDLAIDAVGELPDGRSFDGPDGLKALLKGQGDKFAEALTYKLLLYALGRGLGQPDRQVVNTIATRAAAEGYTFSSVALGIVSSEPFQTRSAERTEGTEKRSRHDHHP
jgi:hypothetical protein